MLNNNIEIWKTIPDFPNYQVSSFGNIVNQHGHIMSPLKHPMGYLAISLARDGISKRFLIHRLVAYAFLQEVLGKTYVNHKDGCKTNNHMDNLEWCTNSENILHARETGLNPYNKPTVGKKLQGQRKGSSKFYGVCWDAARQRWRASVRHNNKVYKQRRFMSEVAAAEHYNALLDELGLTERPRNVI